MRFHSLTRQSLVGAIALAGTLWVMPPAHAQPNPIVQNTGNKVWIFRATQTEPSDRFEAIVVRIPQGNADLFPARIWLYDAVVDAESSTGYSLELTESYVLRFEPRRRDLANRRSNLFANPTQSTGNGSSSPDFSRYFAVTGTKTPGGPATTPPNKRMLRVLTFLTRSPSTGGGGESQSTPTKEEGKPKNVINCEDYPDDEMLEEGDINYDESQDNPNDPAYNPEYDPLTGSTFP